MLAPGTVIGGDYRIVSPLREGGMGAVYVAEQLSTGAQRALKVIQSDMVHDPNLRKRFEQEARVTARIASDHVVQVVGAGVDPNTFTPWMAMELLRGRTLAEAVEQGGPMAPEQVLEIFTQLCHALTAAHQAGVVHRDLKPENLFLAEAQRTSGSPYFVKVLDFGIARVRAEAKTARTIAVGTPLWMAPEQTTAGSNIGTWTDIWPLGLIAFWMLTGREYWRSTDSADPTVSVMREILFDPLVPATQRARELGLGERFPASFDAWFARCVCREADGRYPSAASAREALTAALPVTATLAATALGDARAAHVAPVSSGHTAPGGPPPWSGAPAQGGSPPAGAGQTAFGAPAGAVGPVSSGRTAFGPPAGPPSVGGAPVASASAPRKSSAGLIAGVAVGAVIVLGVVATLGVRAMGSYKSDATCRSTTEPNDKRREACRSACARAKGRGEACTMHGTLLSYGGPAELKEASAVLGSSCEAGDGAACARAAWLTAFPLGGFQAPDAKRAAEHASTACSSAPAHCAPLGVALELGWAKNKEDAASVYDKACGAGDALGCAHRASMPGAKVDDAARAKALTALEPVCAAGDPYACAAVGVLKEHTGVADAAPVLRKACDAGAGLACNNLAALLVEGKGGEAPPDKIFGLFEKACASGEPAGCNNAGAMKSGLGMVLRKGPRGATVLKLKCVKAFAAGCAGWGKPIDVWPGGSPSLEEAVSGFDKACEAGLQTACVNLGAFVLIGQGTPKDRARAHKLFQDACDAGNPGGCGESATLAYIGYAEQAPDRAKAFTLMKKACDGGELDACANSNSFLARGAGTSANPTQAYEAVQALCTEHKVGCGTLAGFALDGLGTTANPTEARRLFQEQCADGAGQDCFDLALLMYQGKGGPKDKDGALRVLDRSCEAHRLDACFGLGFFYADVVQPPDRAKAAQLFKRGCDVGHAQSCNSLAIAHVNGDGMPRDPSRGAQLAREACDDGYLAACATYGILLVNGVGEPKDVNKAKPYLKRACAGEIKDACTKLKQVGG